MFFPHLQFTTDLTFYQLLLNLNLIIALAYLKVALPSDCSIAKAAADDLFGEADDISSDSDAEKPPTPGQPLVSVWHHPLSLFSADPRASLIVPSSLSQASPNLFFLELLANLV